MVVMKSFLRFAMPAVLLAVTGAAQSEIRGTLVDAGCRNRSILNLRRPPETFQASVPVQAQPVTAHGITVEPKTAAAERSDVLEHMVRDVPSRQSDPTCGLSGGTSAYAILLDDGTLLDLDEGGNTLAAEAVYATRQGRDLLNGKAFGFKPRVTIQGRVTGGKVLVDRMQVS
jgi:hypothetical protein